MKSFHYKRSSSQEEIPMLKRLERRHTLINAAVDPGNPQWHEMSYRCRHLQDMQSREPLRTASTQSMESASSDSEWSSPLSTVVITDSDLAASWIYTRKKGLYKAQGTTNEAFEAEPSDPVSPPSPSTPDDCFEDLPKLKLKPIPIAPKELSKSKCCCYTVTAFLVSICFLGLLTSVGGIVYLEFFTASRIPKEFQTDFGQDKNVEKTNLIPNSKDKENVDDNVNLKTGSFPINNFVDSSIPFQIGRNIKDIPAEDLDNKQNINSKVAPTDVGNLEIANDVSSDQDKNYMPGEDNSEGATTKNTNADDGIFLNQQSLESRPEKDTARIGEKRLESENSPSGHGTTASSCKLNSGSTDIHVSNMPECTENTLDTENKSKAIETLQEVEPTPRTSTNQETTTKKAPDKFPVTSANFHPSKTVQSPSSKENAGKQRTIPRLPAFILNRQKNLERIPLQNRKDPELSAGKSTVSSNTPSQNNWRQLVQRPSLYNIIPIRSPPAQRRTSSTVQLPTLDDDSIYIENHPFYSGIGKRYGYSVTSSLQTSSTSETSDRDLPNTQKQDDLQSSMAIVLKRFQTLESVNHPSSRIADVPRGTTRQVPNTPLKQEDLEKALYLEKLRILMYDNS